MAAKPSLPERLDMADPVDPWPDPLPLGDDLPPVLPFQPHLLPGQLRDWVTDIAERMNCPMDLVAIPAMVSAGALIGRKLAIRPQQRTDWQEVGNLWGCVVAPPGSLKSPAAREALAPIRRLEAKAAEDNRAALADFKIKQALHKIEKEAAEKAARSALTGKGRMDPKGAALDALRAVVEPLPPAERRYLTSDATAEKLGEICQANPDGVLIHRDELLALFYDLDHPEKVSARGFFLSGWGGMDSYTFDRIVRGTVHVPAVNLSIIGTTQPHRLAGYMRESLKRFDDGMVQRLQLLAWPDFTGPFREVDRYPDSEARRIAHECYDDLASLDLRELDAQRDDWDGGGGVAFLRFAGEARDEFTTWRALLERDIAEGDLSPAFAGHLSKYRGLIPRLALICHIANGGRGPVSAEALTQAFGWDSYLRSHAMRAYASLSLDNAEAARAIWRKVKKGDLPSPFTARDIGQKGWSGLGDPARIEAGLDALLLANRLRCEKLHTGGRPSVVHYVNPKALAA